jgi:phage terminase large subunit
MAAKRSREELERDIYLLEQEELERVSPKLEILREPRRIKVVYGGRGAGAKTWGFASLLVQRAHREKIKIHCTREVQLSIEESVHKIIKNTIERLRYPGWIIQKEHIYSPCGSYFTFRGMHDLRASEAIKGYEDFDVFWCEEAARLTDESWNVLIPTLRKPGSELWVNFNRVKEADPVYERFVKHQRDDSVVIKCEAGRIDNPWWTDELQREMEEDYKRDPALAEHTWGGEPQNQADNCVWDRASIRGAMARNVEAIGATELGVDVARFGKDNTDIYRRKGMKTVRHKEVHGYDTNEVADAVWDMADRDPSYAIKIDSGYNPGVIDVLRKKGAKVIEV